MSAMLESYDMQMHDYPTDIDIQMHPSSSDQWFHDETKMEEDHPSMKADQYDAEKTEFPIEVEMDSSLLDADTHVNEYEMLDPEYNMHESGSTELVDVDVDVVDISLVHTPSVLPIEMHNVEPTPTTEYSLQDVNITSQSSSESIPHIISDVTPLHILSPATDFKEELLPRPDTESSLVKPTESYDTSVVDAPSSTHTPSTALHELNPTIPAKEEEPTNTESLPQENTIEDTTINFDEPHAQIQEWPKQATEELQPQHTEDAQVSPNLAEAPTVPHTEEGIIYTNDATDTSQAQQDEVENASLSTGDPHEISEGVFIEPPPPVIMSLPQTDLHATFFNSSEGEVQEGTPVIFQHLPTLYYEPLPTVFDALRQESIIRDLPGIDEAELVMDILSLHLRISEDNIYSRDMSLHDLNVLHDAAGLSGSLHISTTTSTPRFIVQYHRLQESINRSSQGEAIAPHVGLTIPEPSDTEHQLPDASTDQTSRDVLPSVEERDEQDVVAQNESSVASSETVGHNADDENEHVQTLGADDENHAEGVERHDHDTELEQAHIDEHESSEASRENEGDGTVNDVPEVTYDEHTLVPVPDEPVEYDNDPQPEALSEHLSSNAGEVQVDVPESAHVEEHVDTQDPNEEGTDEHPDDDESEEHHADDDSSYEEDGEIGEGDDGGADYPGEGVDENGDASSVEDEDESYYELGQVAEEPATDEKAVIPLEALEPAEDDGSSSEDHHTSTLGSRDTSSSSSDGDDHHSSEEVLEAVDEDNYDDEDELHAGVDETVVAYDTNLYETESHLNDVHSENQVEDAKGDALETIYSDQQDFTDGLLHTDADVPELPDEPIEDWDADGDFDYDWDDSKEQSATLSNNESTTTLSSKSSKRTFEEVENSEEYGEWAPASSPDPKRTRTL